MTDVFNVAEFEQIVAEYGLDFGDDSDYQYFQEALNTYPSDPKKNIRKVVERAADLKRGIKPPAVKLTMDEYFRNFRKDLREQASKDAPQPQPKTTKTATEGLDDYFADWRKKQGI